MVGHEQRTWEYRSVSDLTEHQLNELGSEGWELVDVDNGTFILKRPRLNFREQVTLDQKRRYYALWKVKPGGEEAAR